MTDDDWIEELRHGETDELHERFRQQEQIRQAVVATVAGGSEPLPHGIVAPAEVVAEMAAVLVRPSEQCPNGSSFAVGADAPDGHRRLRLSGAAARRLAEHLSPTDPRAWLQRLGIKLRVVA